MLAVSDADRGFQSTLPVWGGTDGPDAGTPEKVISIHPPRVGRDGDVSVPRLI